MTLLVNSKTPREAILHPTLKGQRDRGRYVEPCTPMLLEIQQLRLNQQSHGFLYIYAMRSAADCVLTTSQSVLSGSCSDKDRMV